MIIGTKTLIEGYVEGYEIRVIFLAKLIRLNIT